MADNAYISGLKGARQERERTFAWEEQSRGAFFPELPPPSGRKSGRRRMMETSTRPIVGVGEEGRMSSGNTAPCCRQLLSEFGEADVVGVKRKLRATVARVMVGAESAHDAFHIPSALRLKQSAVVEPRRQGRRASTFTPS